MGIYIFKIILKSILVDGGFTLLFDVKDSFLTIQPFLRFPGLVHEARGLGTLCAINCRSTQTRDRWGKSSAKVPGNSETVPFSGLWPRCVSMGCTLGFAGNPQSGSVKIYGMWLVA